MRYRSFRTAPSGPMPLVISAASLALAVCAAAPAESQEAASAPDAAPALQEVVVTATKRHTSIQNVAASITAITGGDIASRGISDFDSLAQSVPGLALRTSGPGLTEFEMRGLSSSGGNSSMVGLYIGEYPLSAPASSQLGKVDIDPDLYDLERVEVLRGPQGTLYGASSMGGAVRLIPAPPRLGRFDASADQKVSDTASGGAINTETSGMVNLPVGSSAAVRVVGSVTQDSGWIKRIVLQDGVVPVDQPLGDAAMAARPAGFTSAPVQAVYDGVNTASVDSVRAELLWRPAENLTVEPMLMYQLTQQGGPPNVDVGGSAARPSVPAVAAHYEIYDTPEPLRDRFTLGGLTLIEDLPSFSITSATAYWNRGTLTSEDATEEDAVAVGLPAYDASAGGIGPTGPAPSGSGATERDYTAQLSEELRLTSRSTGPVQWIVGYFYQDLRSEFDLWLIAPQATPVLGGTSLYTAHQPADITQNAEFGEVSWTFLPGWKATVGLRHYHFGMDQAHTEYGLFTTNGYLGNTVPYSIFEGTSASGTVPKFDLSYHITPDTMVYAVVSKGFRLGGVNWPIPVSYATDMTTIAQYNECSLQQKLLNLSSCNPKLLLSAPIKYSSDTVRNYEVGVKSTLLDHRLRVDASAFVEEWENPQLATNVDGYGLFTNGAPARSRGVEAEAEALLGEGWDLSVNSSYTSAKFLDSDLLVGFPAGTAVPDTPKWTASAVLHWDHELEHDRSLFGALEADYVGARTDAPYGTTITVWNASQEITQLPGYTLVNVNFGVRASQWKAMLYIENLANREVLLDPQPQIAFQTAAYSRYTVNRPRTVGVEVRYRFQ